MLAASGSDFLKQVSNICLTSLPYFSQDKLHLQIAPDSSLRQLRTFCYPFHISVGFVQHLFLGGSVEVSLFIG